MINQRSARLHDPGYLAWLRKRHCLTCGKPSPVDAAHIRMACVEIGKSHTGMAEKPHDFWSVPLCRACHTTQHECGEFNFWKGVGIDPFIEAIRLYNEYGGTGGKPKSRKPVKPRKPPEKRAKIKSRGFAKIKRKVGGKK